MVGYIRDYRKELESDIWLMPPLYHRVWQYLKYKVNHTDVEIPQPDGSTLIIKRGQHLTSLREIAEGVSWMEGRVKKTPNPHTISKILDFMVKRNMIAIEDTKKSVRGNRTCTLISLINWEKYNSYDVTGNTARHTGVTERAQNNNELIINKNINTITPIIGVEDSETSFKELLEEPSRDEPSRAENPFIRVLDAYCNLHRKIDVNVSDLERQAIKGLIANNIPAEFIIDVMKKIFAAKKQREGQNFDPPGTFTYYQKPIVKAWRAEQGSQTDAQVPALPSVAPGYSSQKPQRGGTQNAIFGQHHAGATGTHQAYPFSGKTGRLKRTDVQVPEV